eukprot:scaffold21681_cov27-Tisochrysis_lutea.AAC.7
MAGAPASRASEAWGVGDLAEARHESSVKSARASSVSASTSENRNAIWAATTQASRVIASRRSRAYQDCITGRAWSSSFVRSAAAPATSAARVCASQCSEPPAARSRPRHESAAGTIARKAAGIHVECVVEQGLEATERDSRRMRELLKQEAHRSGQVLAVFSRDSHRHGLGRIRLPETRLEDGRIHHVLQLRVSKSGRVRRLREKTKQQRHTQIGGE